MDEFQRKDDALFDALNKSKKKKRRRRLITVLVIVGVVVVALLIGISILRKKVEARMSLMDTEVLNYTAAYGNISTRVSSSGTIEDVDTEQITVPKGVKVEKVTARTNNALKEGDVIATVDLSTVISAMASVQEKIDKLDEELKKASSDQVSAAVPAGTNGRVKRVYVQKDDDVAACMVENGALALISLDGYLAVEFENSSLAAGDVVQVQREDGSMLQGKMLELAGAVNCAADLKATELWPTAGTEQIFAWDPDYIFITNSESAVYSAEDILKDPAWSQMKAVRNKHVYVMPAAADSWEFPGVVSTLGIDYMTHIMHPDLMDEQTLVQNVDEFYELSYGRTFSREELGY